MFTECCTEWKIILKVNSTTVPSRMRKKRVRCAVARKHKRTKPNWSLLRWGEVMAKFMGIVFVTFLSINVHGENRLVLVAKLDTRRRAIH